MKVSIVVCTYSPEMYYYFEETIESLLSQTHDDIEIVTVVDGTESVNERVRDDYGDCENVVIHINEENVGLLESRNTGADVARGDVVAFIDDDAVADEQWIEELVSAYEGRDVTAAGGRMTPIWVAGKPSFLPEEFYWLVGVTHRGFADGPGYVRNTFGSNLSFRRDVFLGMGGIRMTLGL
jgi:glycosyltransferase involved in cell wall biosynthesis